MDNLPAFLIRYTKLPKLLNMGSMKYARSKGKIIQNPVDLVVLPFSSSTVYKRKKNGKDNSLEIFTDDEILRFVDATNAIYSNGQRIYKNGSLT